MADRPVLVCIEGSLDGQVIPVVEGSMEIGRSPDNDLVLDHDDGVSRFHARLLYDNGSLWLRDAGSRNGVFVNEAKIGEHKALKMGDNIRIGATVFVIQWEEDAARPQTSRRATKRPWFWPFE